MNKRIPCVILVWVLAGPQTGLSARDLPLAAGRLLACALDEPDFSSRTALVGDPLICYARPIHEFDCTVFPRGTQLAGHFVEYRNPGRLIGKGWMKLEFDRIILPEGEAPITARVVSIQGFRVDAEGRIHGRGHARRDAVGWAIPVLWPVKGITLLERGPVPRLKGERVITLRLLDDVRVPCSNWKHFGSEEQSYLPSSSSRTQMQRTDENDLVVDVGKHTLRVTNSRARPAPDTQPLLDSSH